VREQRLAQFYDIKGGALIQNKIKFSSYIRKFGVEQLQSHTVYEDGCPVYEEMREHFVIYEEALSQI
jgi:hypothetical protein